MKRGIEDVWTWHVHADSPWPFPGTFARKDILPVLGCWYSFGYKTSSFIIWTQVLLLLTDGIETELIVHFRSQAGSIASTSVASCPCPTSYPPFRKGEGNTRLSRVAAESHWQPINVGMKCAPHWVAHYRTLDLLKKVGKTIRILLSMVTWIKSF